MKKTSIGGQAVIEGVMMRGVTKTAMAVRHVDGDIRTEMLPQSSASKAWYKKVPFIRGLFNMIDMLLVGYRSLNKSIDLSGFIEEEEEPSAFERKLTQLLGDKLTPVITTVSLILGVLLSLTLFVVLPTLLVFFLKPWIASTIVLSLIEGLLKITILVIFLWAMSKTEDTKRLFAYHGAEHKTIFCYEAGKPLTVENVRSFKRFHPRCGTSFILIVLVLSIVIFSMVTFDHPMIRILLKIASFPLVVGIGYEIIRLAGRHDNIITRIISAPGMWLQHITTYEPDDAQIEVAIAAILPVLPEKDEDDRW